ncbi:MAG TPA: helix-turn-helix domain-containing protein [Candidatus Saccharimonas sp.]|nr:helix-turn-helix domain-containing protein [Candidatus Saccharimonas sp.]
MVRNNSTEVHTSPDCAWREVVDIIGDKWSVMILHTICTSQMRYSEIHRQIPGISQKVLTTSLRQLERDGIIKRTIYPVVPPKVEYELTPLGNSVFEVIESLRTWSIAHLDEIEAARSRYDLHK